MSESYPQTVTKVTGFPFTVERESLYRISVIARCKSGAQIGERGGEDLRVEIDGIKLREIPPQDNHQYFDIPPAWNGTRLKGLSMSVTLILRLSKGTHTLVFVPRRGAVIDRAPVIERIEDPRHAVFELNEQAEDGDRRPWHTFALIGLPLRSVSAEATVGWRFRDSDDVKLIVDGKIKKNPFSLFHRDWTWSGSVVKKIFGKERQKKTFEESLGSSDHHVEFWADRTPTLHRVSLDLGDSGGARVPTVDDPRWTGNFRDDSDQILLARAIFGEARDTRLSDRARIGVGWSIRNRVEDARWADNYHDVITQPLQYSAFNDGDANHPFVEDPLHTGKAADKEAWVHCYTVAGNVLSGEVEDPADGSNHYYDDSISAPYWATPETFVVKIETLIFHRL